MIGMKKYKLGDIASIFAGGDAPKENMSSFKNDQFSIPIYSNGIECEGIYGYTNFARVTEQAITVSARGTIGVPFRRKEPYFPIVRLISIIPDNQIVDVDYLYYYIKNTPMVGEGSVQSQLTVPMVREYKVSLPPLPVQQKVASVLSSLDKKIALNKQINQNLEALARQLYDYWFVQFDFPDANGKPYKSSGGKMVYNPILKREIPEGWDNGVLSDIANITMGQSPDGSSYNEEGDGVIFYQGSTDFGDRFPKIRQYTTSPSRFAKKGDILMSVRAPVGDLNIANNDCCIGRGLSALNSKLGSITHLYYIMLSFKDMFEQKSAIGTTFGSINKDELY